MARLSAQAVIVCVILAILFCGCGTTEYEWPNSNFVVGCRLRFWSAPRGSQERRRSGLWAAEIHNFHNRLRCGYGRLAMVSCRCCRMADWRVVARWRMRTTRFLVSLRRNSPTFSPLNNASVVVTCPHLLSLRPLLAR